MTRPTLRRSPMMERLETRQVLSSVAGLAAEKQYVLEMINQVRTNPRAAALRLTSDLSPQVQTTLDHYGLTVDGLRSKLAAATPLPPVAYSGSLDNVAQGQSQFEADNAVQSHQGAGGQGIGDRFAAAGYSQPLTEAENTYAYARSADEAMQSFLFDWGVADGGHYRNLLQPGTAPRDSFQEVGIGLVSTDGRSVGPLVLTQDFGRRQGAGPQILGVSYGDSDHDKFYTPGEGKAGLTIDALNLSTRQKYETHSGDSGGYQIPVAANSDYQVSATLDGKVVQSQTIHVGDMNEKVDFILDSRTPSQIAPQILIGPDHARAAEPVPVEVSTPPPSHSTPPTPPAPATPPPTPSTPTPLPSISHSEGQPAWWSKWSRWKAINGARES